MNRAISLAPEDSATLLLLAYVERKRKTNSANSTNASGQTGESALGKDHMEQIQPTGTES